MHALISLIKDETKLVCKNWAVSGTKKNQVLSESGCGERSDKHTSTKLSWKFKGFLGLSMEIKNIYHHQINPILTFWYLGL